MSIKPRVYVSSTIYDFADLRSALKYWLEEFDLEVQMSEFNDFEVNLDLNSFQACLDSISRCDYFILLIGKRKGAWYLEPEKTSITQKEYRTAYELAKKGDIKILSFVRRSIWNIKEDRKAIKKEAVDLNVNEIKSDLIEDPEFVFDFIDEVRRATEMKQAIKEGAEYPSHNWIYLFDNFKDISDALKINLNLFGDLREKAIRCNLKDELERNLIKSDIKIKDGIYTGNAVRILQARSSLKLDPKFDTESIIVPIEKKLLIRTAASWILLRFDSSNFALKEAIKSAIFLDYDKEKGEYIVGKIQRLLLRLNEYIEQLDKISHSKIHETATEYALNLINASKSRRDKEILVDIYYLIPIFYEAIYYWNIHQISSYIHEFLSRVSAQQVELYNPDFFSNMEKEIIS